MVLDFAAPTGSGGAVRDFANTRVGYVPGCAAHGALGLPAYYSGKVGWAGWGHLHRSRLRASKTTNWTQSVTSRTDNYKPWRFSAPATGAAVIAAFRQMAVTVNSFFSRAG